MPLDDVFSEFRDSLQLTTLVQANAGPGAARNHGAANARGDLLVFTDDDCRPDRLWLEQLVTASQGNPGCMCGGGVTNGIPENPFASTSQLILDIIYDVVNADHGNAVFLTTNNLLIPTVKFFELGGFDERFRAAEDREFCQRWRKAGGRVVYAPYARVDHFHEMDFSGFCRQHFAYGRGAFSFHQLQAPGSMRGSVSFHRDPRNWLTRPYRDAPRGAARRLVALLVVWQVVNAAGFFWEGAAVAMGQGAVSRQRHSELA